MFATMTRSGKQSSYGRRFLLGMLLLMLLPGVVLSQVEIEMIGFGPRAGLSIDPDQLVFGAFADFAGVHEDLLWTPIVELATGDDIFTVNFELDCLYWIPGEDMPAEFLVGAGLAFAYYNWDSHGFGDSSATEAGLELIGCARKVGPGNYLYRFEVKVGVGDIPDFKLMLGMNL